MHAGTCFFVVLKTLLICESCLREPDNNLLFIHQGLVRKNQIFLQVLVLLKVNRTLFLGMQMDQVNLFNTVPLPLSQGVLLSLVQQLGCDLGKDTARKLSWIREAVLALNPGDPLLAPHMRPFLEQLYQNLHRQVQLTTIPAEQANLRLVIHVVHSLLTSCK